MTIRITPLVRAPALESRCLGQVYLKLENLQTTGSFKLRGATQAIESLSLEERKKGVITASAGNHGAGLASAAVSLTVNVSVVVPVRTPENKILRMRQLGALVTVKGDDYDESESIARKMAGETGAIFVSAFDDEEVMAGNGGSLGSELLSQCPKVTRVIVPIGGGGLIGGLANRLAPTGVNIIGVQPKNNCAMFESLRDGKAYCQYEGETTVAEGCEGAVSVRTYAAVKQHVSLIGLVSEASIVNAVVFLYEECGVVAEASGAVAVAGLLENSILLKESDVTVVVVSGGNIDEETLSSYLVDSLG